MSKYKDLTVIELESITGGNAAGAAVVAAMDVQRQG